MIEPKFGGVARLHSVGGNSPNRLNLIFLQEKRAELFTAIWFRSGDGDHNKDVRATTLGDKRFVAVEFPFGPLLFCGGFHTATIAACLWLCQCPSGKPL